MPGSSAASLRDENKPERRRTSPTEPRRVGLVTCLAWQVTRAASASARLSGAGEGGEQLENVPPTGVRRSRSHEPGLEASGL